MCNLGFEDVYKFLIDYDMDINGKGKITCTLFENMLK